MSTVNLSEAEANLAALLDRAAAGEDIVIAKSGEPVVRLVPITPPVQANTPRPLGLYAGLVTIGPDFDDPLPEDIMRAFE